ncbi:MAG: menaquinone reductase multiheme cytochrome c subunit QrcA [Thermoanaerobaculia bacterium]
MTIRSLITFGSGLLAALAFGWIAFPQLLYRTAEQPVQFNHAIHTGETGGLACEDCHSLGEDGNFSGLPTLEQCAGCHSSALGETAEEKRFIEKYVTPGREVPWLVYSRQPENVYFSHAAHLKLAKLECRQCHGAQGTSTRLRPFAVDRISTYSRDIDGPGILLARDVAAPGMKMHDCARCHRERGVREGCLTCHK